MYGFKADSTNGSTKFVYTIVTCFYFERTYSIFFVSFICFFVLPFLAKHSHSFRYSVYIAIVGYSFDTTQHRLVDCRQTKHAYRHIYIYYILICITHYPLTLFSIHYSRTLLRQRNDFSISITISQRNSIRLALFVYCCRSVLRTVLYTLYTIYNT